MIATIDDPAPPRSGDRRWLLVTVAVTALAAIGSLLLNRRFYFSDDTQIGAFWNWWELGHALRDGRWPMLDPSRWMGGNAHAEGQWGLWNPLSLLLALGASFAANAALYASLVKILFLVVAAVGTDLLARDRGVPGPIASVAGIAVTLTGFTVYIDATSWVTGLMTWALLPWAWLAIVRLSERRGGILPAFAAGFSLVAIGYVHGTLMLAVVIVAVFVARLVQRDRAGAVRVLGAGGLIALVVITVYLPGAATSGVTVRAQRGIANNDILSTDLAGLVSSVSSEAAAVLPAPEWWGTYAPGPLLYIAWFLPVLFFVDWTAARRQIRRLTDIALVLAGSALFVLGPTDIGPLRFPVRVMPHLSMAAIVAVAVLLTTAAARPVSRARLLGAVAWIGVGTYLAWSGQPTQLMRLAVAAIIAAGGLVLTRWLIERQRSDRVRWPAVAIGMIAVTLVASGTQRLERRGGIFPDFGLLPAVDLVRELPAGASSDVLVVGKPSERMAGTGAPVWSEVTLGSAWWGAEADVQNVYTPVAFAEYGDLMCMDWRGQTCPEVLGRLFRPQPTTGLDLVDQLSINSLVVFKDDVGARWSRPPAGWSVAADGPLTATWVRAEPVPRAGGVVWASDGVEVREVSRSQTEVELAIDAVPSDGGTVVFSRLAWPGYAASNADIGEPTDEYLLTVEIPADSVGDTVRVRFRPPGWRIELTTLGAALAGAAVWAIVDVRRRRRSGSASLATETPVED